MFPSRDHTAATSSSGSKVKRALLAPMVLSSQTSTLLALISLMSTATRVLSGERVGFAMILGSPIRPSSFPDRSIHVKTDKAAPTPVLYTSVPLPETAKAAQ